MLSDAQSLHQRLQHSDGFRRLMEQATRIAELNRALRQWTQEPWLDSIRLVNVRDDTVVIYASTAAALVPLRYRQQALLAFLQERFNLNCSKIEAKVKPLFHTS